MIVSLVKRNLHQLANEIIEGLRPKYDLVYVDYRDELDESLKSLIAANDMDHFWETKAGDQLWAWEGDSRESSITEIIKDDAKLILRRWEGEDDVDYDDLLDSFEGSAEWDRVREVISDRDSGDWFKQLIRQSGDVLLRINVIDEDHGYSFEPVEPQRVLTDVGLPITDANVEAMRDTLAECSPEYSVLMGYWIAGVDLSDLYELPQDCTEVEIVNPYLYLGNPFAGSGWISEKPFEGVVKVARDALKTDKEAFGYSVNEVYGGLYPSQFQCETRPVAKEAQQ